MKNGLDLGAVEISLGPGAKNVAQVHGELNPDATRWVSTPPGFFLPVRVLSLVFRAKLLEALDAAIGRGDIRSDPCALRTQLRCTARTAWVVYSKPPFGGPDQVIRYLGRYTHRVAMSNRRLVALKDDRVTLTWRDRRHGDRKKLLTLQATELLRRFLLHVLPKGFVRIPSYGLLANGVKKKRLALCRRLLDAAPSEPPPDDGWEALLERLTGEDPWSCPRCKTGRLQRILVLKRWTVYSATQSRPP